MSEETNEHIFPRRWGKTVYWNGNTACGVLDPWTAVDVHVYPDTLNIPLLRFTTAQTGEFVATMRALDRVFDWGKRKQNEAIRALLEVREE